MKKSIPSVLLVFCLLLCFGCSGKGPDRTEPVFETEGIVSVSFREGPGEWIPVDEEELPDYLAWLASFRIGEKWKKPIPPGSNSVLVRVEYGDGTVREQGLTTVTVGGNLYHLEYGTPPASYPSLLYAAET